MNEDREGYLKQRENQSGKVGGNFRDNKIKEMSITEENEIMLPNVIRTTWGLLKMNI